MIHLFMSTLDPTGAECNHIENPGKGLVKHSTKSFLIRKLFETDIEFVSVQKIVMKFSHFLYFSDFFHIIPILPKNKVCIV